MSEDTIYLRFPDGDFERVRRTPFETEDLLQGLVEKYPALLAGEQINPDQPTRWLLVKREAGIPSEEGGGSRWSVDHLLLDQEGVPTFVEVKRSSDTRIRREVVGQMLDYAANAGKYWPEDRIRSLAAVQYENSGGIDQRIAELLDRSFEPDLVEDYWSEVGRNLKTGRLRLLFVADEIPSELKRIIEFLNLHFDSIEVLGVEVKQYQSAEIQAVVPQVIGQTEAARDQKRGSRPTRRDLTPDELVARVEPETRPLVQRVLEEARRDGFVVKFTGSGFNVRSEFGNGPKAVMYFYLRETFGRSEGDLIQGYTGHLPQAMKPEAQEVFEEVPYVRRGGDYTFEIDLGIHPNAGEALWNAVRRVGSLKTKGEGVS